MGQWLTIDWSEMFVPQLSLTVILVRAALLYLGLCVLLRIIPKRQVGKASVSDLLLVILLGEVAGEGLSRQAESLTDVLLVLLVMLLLDYAVDWLAFRSPLVRGLIQHSPTCLVRDGRVLEANLRREMITAEDLKMQLRQQDVDDLARVQQAQLESDGSISVVTRQDNDGQEPRQPTTPAEGPGGEAEGAAGRPNDPADDDDAELSAFLAAARRLQARLEWHQQQLARGKAALARHGVRFRPAAAAAAEPGQPAAASEANGLA